MEKRVKDVLGEGADVTQDVTVAVLPHAIAGQRTTPHPLSPQVDSAILLNLGRDAQDSYHKTLVLRCTPLSGLRRDSWLDMYISNKNRLLHP